MCVWTAAPPRFCAALVLCRAGDGGPAGQRHPAAGILWGDNAVPAAAEGRYLPEGWAGVALRDVISPEGCRGLDRGCERERDDAAAAAGCSVSAVFGQCPGSRGGAWPVSGRGAVPGCEPRRSPSHTVPPTRHRGLYPAGPRLSGRPALKQGCNPVGDEFAHGQGGVGTFNAGNGEDGFVDAEEVLGVERHDPQQQIGGTGQPMRLDHLRNRRKVGRDFRQALLLYMHVHKRHQRVAQCHRIDPAFEGEEGALLLHSGKPRLHGVPGDSQTRGKGHNGPAGISGHGPQNAEVGAVQNLHSAQR